MWVVLGMMLLLCHGIVAELSGRACGPPQQRLLMQDTGCVSSLLLCTLCVLC